MPRRNRVTPLGELIADPARGLVYANRGCLHDDAGEIRRRYNGKRWIACRLAFRGWRRHPLMQPGRFTELFFLDEATAFAAGHRPCALCRHDDYKRFVDIWDTHHRSGTNADAIDAELHRERLDPGTGAHRLHEAPFGDLPDGAFVLVEGTPHVVLARTVVRWTPGGYEASAPRPRGTATLITPPSLLAVLQTGWSGVVPFLHPSAGRK